MTEMTHITTLRPALLMRLQFIECMLFHYDRINRGVLADYFGLSIPQASADIGLYLELAPHNAVYDKSIKAYRRAELFQRLWV
jgi:hypothetical protein